MKGFFVFIFTGVFLLNFAWAAGFSERGEKLSASCVACHGVSGRSNNAAWPNLAGQKNAYLKKQLLDFKLGKRSDPMMTPISQTLSDQDVEDLAAYYSGVR